MASPTYIGDWYGYCIWLFFIGGIAWLALLARSVDRVEWNLQHRPLIAWTQIITTLLLGAAGSGFMWWSIGTGFTVWGGPNWSIFSPGDLLLRIGCGIAWVGWCSAPLSCCVWTSQVVVAAWREAHRERERERKRNAALPHPSMLDSSFMAVRTTPVLGTQVVVPRPPEPKDVRGDPLPENWTWRP
jgi:hypothetical protein